MRYHTCELSESRYTLWDNKLKDFVRKGHTWTKELIERVVSLKKQGFSVVIL